MMCYLFAPYLENIFGTALVLASFSLHKPKSGELFFKGAVYLKNKKLRQTLTVTGSLVNHRVTLDANFKCRTQ